ncbi:MAG: HesA/MoeB/ThiF family protein [Rikenellaceae bacterium]
MLNKEDKERYLRQIALGEIREQGQQRLSRSSALIIGVGGLGSPIATLLASSGMGRIGIVDSDTVSLSNLPRQTLYTTEDIGKPKVECAKKRLQMMNPTVEIETYNLRFEEDCAQEIASKYDMIIDGCDNMPTRYTIDSIAKELKKPYIYGAINGFRGQVSVFHHQGSGAYGDLFPKENALPPSPPPAVMSTTPALIGAIQANEAIKIAIGYGEVLGSKLLVFDSRDYSFQILNL